MTVRLLVGAHPPAFPNRAPKRGHKPYRPIGQIPSNFSWVPFHSHKAIAISAIHQPPR